MNTSFTRGSLALALSLAILGATPLAVLAANVKIAGSDAFSITASAGGLTAAQRAQVVQSNLDNALVAANDKSPSSVKIVYVKGTPVVTLGGYSVVTVDAASAKSAGTTPAVLAQRWADGIKRQLANSGSVQRYVAQLSGGSSSSGSSYSGSGSGSSASTNYQRAKVVYVPAGMVLPISLNTSITTQTAKAGDPIQATLAEDVNLGDNVIPSGSVITGKIVAAKAGQRLDKSGSLTIAFDTLRTPDGSSSAIKGHLVGGVEKLEEGTDTMKGETTADKIKTAAIHGAIGAGAGTVAGLTIGAIASRHGRGVGRGAWSGLAIGAGLGVAESLLLRKGSDVVLPSGQTLKLQLDAPATLALRCQSGAM